MATVPKFDRTLTLSLIIIATTASGAPAGQTGVAGSGGNVSYTPQGKAVIDVQHARPQPLPRAVTAPSPPPATGVSAKTPGPPALVPGSRGNGQLIPETWTPPVPEGTAGMSGSISPREYGTSNQPFTTSRVDLWGNIPSKYFPYRPAGKLYFSRPDGTYVCSAALIKRGLIVTAAHCVAEFGAKTFYDGWMFVPALSNNKRPYGSWYVRGAWIKESWYDGTDSCSEPGVVCQNDVAVLVIAPRGRATYPGRFTGWYGYGYNGWGFTPGSTALVSQLGYPVSHDYGYMMQRTDSQGYVSVPDTGNTVWGSRQGGGSSGGPAVVNLGVEPYLSDVAYGTDSDFNVVVGVTSWWYGDPTIMQQGASPFTANNIQSLVDSACMSHPDACAP